MEFNRKTNLDAKLCLNVCKRDMYGPIIDSENKDEIDVMIKSIKKIRSNINTATCETGDNDKHIINNSENINLESAAIIEDLVNEIKKLHVKIDSLKVILNDAQQLENIGDSKNMHFNFVV